jgi:hypothetical protein
MISITAPGPPAKRPRMPDLEFAVEGAEAIPYAAAPTIGFKVRIRNADPFEPIRNVALQVQLQIESAQRSYNAGEKERLNDLFGDPSRWGQTLKTLLWTRTQLFVAPFTGETVAEVLVHCTFDFNVAVTKYFAGLEAGFVPVALLFSGTVFYEGDGRLQIGQISWSREATYRLPLSVWRTMMDLYYPNTAWMCLERPVFDRLIEYKTRRGIGTLDRALDDVLDAAEEMSGIAAEAGQR